MEHGGDINAEILRERGPASLPHPAHHPLAPPVRPTHRHHRTVQRGSKLMQSHSLFIPSIKHCDTFLHLPQASYFQDHGTRVKWTRYRASLPRPAVSCSRSILSVFISADSSSVVVTLSRFSWQVSKESRDFPNPHSTHPHTSGLKELNDLF